MIEKHLTNIREKYVESSLKSQSTTVVNMSDLGYLLNEIEKLRLIELGTKELEEVVGHTI